MKVKLSLKRTSGSSVDIVVTADSTATVEDVARSIATNDPRRLGAGIPAGVRVTLAVAPPTSETLVALEPDVYISEAAIGSGFNASVIPFTGRTGTRTGTDAAASLRIHTGPEAGRTVGLPIGNTVVGRGAEADVTLPDPLISK